MLDDDAIAAMAAAYPSVGAALEGSRVPSVAPAGGRRLSRMTIAPRMRPGGAAPAAPAAPSAEAVRRCVGDVRHRDARRRVPRIAFAPCPTRLARCCRACCVRRSTRRARPRAGSSRTDGDELVLRAAVGAATQFLGTRVAADSGFAGYVAASGQPLAMSPRRDDARGAEGIAALIETRPGSVLAVPCGTDDAVHGVLELVEKLGGGPFSFDDVEIATLLAGIAGTALSSDGTAASDVPPPHELADGLARLASDDPQRYAALATFLAAALNDG